jgi:glucose/mannose-6-phosphate isomerase
MSNLKEFEKNYLESIYSYPKQFKEAWEKSTKIQFPFEYGNISDVIIAGMGGSAFGGHLLKSVFSDEKILVPVEVITQYDLPGYADEKTLVLVTSYSGNTEETLNIIKQAKTRGCKVAVITSGGKLKNLLSSENYPGYVFDAKLNTSGAPRTSVGYLLGATLGILSALKLLNFNEKDASETIKYIDTFTKYLAKDSKLVVQMAQKIYGTAPVFICAEHLTASAHIWRNFFNETSKNIGFLYEIPEMNHHFLDSLLYPKELREKLSFVFIKSELYNARNQKRMDITRQVIKKSGYMDISIMLSATNKINQAWELIIIGSLVSYHMAKIHGANPSSNEFVDYLKEQLNK